METRQLSCREGGNFDRQANHPPSKWGQISSERAKKGISRRIRVWKGIANRKTLSESNKPSL